MLKIYFYFLTLSAVFCMPTFFVEQPIWAHDGAGADDPALAAQLVVHSVSKRNPDQL